MQSNVAYGWDGAINTLVAGLGIGVPVLNFAIYWPFSYLGYYIGSKRKERTEDEN